MAVKLTSKEQLLNKLSNYSITTDDFIVFCKEKIKNKLLSCPELLYAINSKSYEHELFNSDGTINYEGEWDLYFGDNIRPYLFIPEAQTEAKNFVCYQINIGDPIRNNKKETYCNAIFTIMCDSKDAFDQTTGIPRHDLIASILREEINRSNIFGLQCTLVESSESSLDSNYVVRTIKFTYIIPNHIVLTDLQKRTSIIV